jgi:hypothetical protein
MMMIVTSSVTLFISIIVMFVQPQHKVWSLVSKKQETTLAKTFQKAGFIQSCRESERVR